MEVRAAKNKSGDLDYLKEIEARNTKVDPEAKKLADSVGGEVVSQGEWPED